MTLCNTREQLFKSTNILILNVSNTDDVEEILIGKDGLYKYEKHPKLVIDMSTICPIKTKQISQKLKKKNIYMFDCPVSGGETGAINRKLSIMVGGEFKNYYKISNILNKIAKKLKWNGKINWDTRPHRPGEIYYLSSKNDKAKKLLGWKPKVKLDEGINKTIELWQNQS